VQVPLARHRKTEHAQRTDARLARRIVIAPGDVILRAVGDDLGDDLSEAFASETQER